MGNKPAKPSTSSTVISPSTKQQDADPEEYTFAYIITTIDVIEKGDVEDVDTYGEGAKNVEFHGKIKADMEDEDVAYLMNVRKSDDDIFKAVSVSKETFEQKLAAENKKVLGCVHGFTVEPEQWWAECKAAATSDHFEHLILPVMWPSVGKNILKYDTEQGGSVSSGVAFTSTTGLSKAVPLSLMCHSMGNRFLMSYAKEAEDDQKFENIFMVSADVWEEVFNERVITDTWFQPPWNYYSKFNDAGLKLCNSMKDGRKIHIINYDGDIALISSWFENRRRRLGRYGKEGQSGRIDERCDDKLVGLDVQAYKDEIKEADSMFLHSYHFMPRLLKYYNDTMNE